MEFEHYGRPKPELDGLHQAIPGCKMMDSFLALLIFLLAVKLYTEKDVDNSSGLEEILINININPFHSSPLEPCFQTVDCDLVADHEINLIG